MQQYTQWWRGTLDDLCCQLYLWHLHSTLSWIFGSWGCWRMRSLQLWFLKEPSARKEYHVSVSSWNYNMSGQAAVFASARCLRYSELSEGWFQQMARCEVFRQNRIWCVAEPWEPLHHIAVSPPVRKCRRSWWKSNNDSVSKLTFKDRGNGTITWYQGQVSVIVLKLNTGM